MPMLVRTPEDWFREQQRDLYIIQYRRPGDADEEDDAFTEEDEPTQEEARSIFMQAQIALNHWFEEKLPNTPLTIIGPSEYSGWITGGPSYFTADFDEDALALFNADWDANSPWYIEVWPVADWRKRIDGAHILPSPVEKLEKLRWWDLPQGIVLMSAYTTNPGYCEDGFLSRYDAWWCLQQLFLELKDMEMDAFPYGYFQPSERDSKHVDILVEYVLNPSWDSRTYSANAENKERIKHAIGITDDIAIDMSVYEF